MIWSFSHTAYLYIINIVIDYHLKPTLLTCILLLFYLNYVVDLEYNFIMSNLTSRTGSSVITFDTYLKIRARFEQLNKEYQNKNIREDKEAYFGKNFFKKF